MFKLFEHQLPILPTVDSSRAVDSYWLKDVH